jgi:PPOX class probable F420-dependent enzyme
MNEITPAVRQFLDTQRNVVISTVRSDGSPQISPVWYLFDGEAFIISTAKETAKWHNLLRDPRVALCVDEPDTGRMVVAYGRAELADEDIWDTTRMLVEKYVKEPAAVQAHMERIFKNWTRVIVKLKPERVIPHGFD